MKRYFVLLVFAVLLGVSFSSYSWENTFINNTDETVTIMPMYLRTLGPTTYTRDMEVLEHGKKVEKHVGAGCVAGIVVFKGDRSKDVRIRLLPKGVKDGWISAGSVDALVGKLISYTPPISPDPLRNDTRPLYPDLVIIVPGWENRCKNWDFTITKNDQGNLVGSIYGHF